LILGKTGGAVPPTVHQDLYLNYNGPFIESIDSLMLNFVPRSALVKQNKTKKANTNGLSAAMLAFVGSRKVTKDVDVLTPITEGWEDAPIFATL
jgi:hypothetical protein